MVSGPGDGVDRRRLLLIAVACLAAVFLLDGWLHLVGPLPGERAVGRWWTHWTPATDAPADVNSALTFFDSLATPWIAAATVLVAAAIVWENDGERWAALVLASSGVVILNSLLKHLLGPTPLWDQLGYVGRNYPSGHVAYVTAVGGVLALITARHRQRAATIALAALTPLMAVDRVVAGAHLPSDAIAGVLVGAAWALCAVALIAPADALQRPRATR